MQTFQRVLEKLISGVPNQVLLKMVEEKLSEHGVKLNAPERRALRARMKTNRVSNFKLRRPNSSSEHTIEIGFTEQDALEVRERCTRIVEEVIPVAIERVVDKFSPRILAQLKKDWRSYAAGRHQFVGGFRERLERRWQKPLAKMEMLIVMSTELGESLNKELRSNRASENLNLINVLTRLHARASLIAEEVLCLLRNGFADGAIARWRTLHEIAVISMFMAQHGEETARRYADHDIVESRKAADDYQACCEKVGYEPFTAKEMEDLENASHKAISKYGSAFRKSYGWASLALGMDDPKFADIERATGVDHLRSYYRMASHNIHANPKGIFFQLGIMPESEILLAGPSNSGFTDPAQCTALSLIHVSSALVSLSPNFDRIVAIRVMTLLADEVSLSFLKVQEKTNAEEEKWRVELA